MAHKYFHLHKRPSAKKGKCIYYVQFYDEYGNRLTAKSTGMTSKAAAENWSYEQLRKGLVFVNKKITFSEYARDWWIWDKCQYIKRKLARNTDKSRGLFRGAVALSRTFDVDIRPIPSYTDSVDSLTFYSINN